MLEIITVHTGIGGIYMKCKHLRIAVLVLAMIVMLATMTQAAFAEGEEQGEHAKRTVLMYVCGSDLESRGGMATFNLRQVLGADFSADDDVKYIVMTGGAEEWQLDDDKDRNNDNNCLVFPENVNVPDDAIYRFDKEESERYGNPHSQISNMYNQVWEAKGADAPENAGKMVLLDGDGITGDGPVQSFDELMSKPETLKAFINYGVKNYPADRYDLILWDHANGPTDGYAYDAHDDGSIGMMSFSNVIDAIAHNDVTDPENPEEAKKFDIINFDACLMNSVELNMVLADYADIYIASPESEPGYGQDYSGWLNAVGADPDMDAYALGKKVVDDYYDFYEYGKGKGQDGTLAVVDLEKLIKSDLIGALSDMSTLLRQQAAQGLFYDEFSTGLSSIRYGQYMNYFDLGNFASLITVVNMEIAQDELDKEHIKTDNVYTAAGITDKICGVLEDEDIIYSCGTSGITSRDKVYRHVGGELEMGDLHTSGMYLFFTTTDVLDKGSNLLSYCDEVNKVIDMMPVKDDGRCKFLKDYLTVLADYTLIGSAGRAVNWLMIDENKDRKDIDYAMVRNYWMDGDETQTWTDWAELVKPMLEIRGGGETEEAKSWLDSIIKQQAEEAISPENVTAKKARTKEGTGYKVRIADTRARAVESILREVNIEFSATEASIKETFDSEIQEMVRHSIGFKAGAFKGYISTDDIDMEKATAEDLIRWYNRNESYWDIDTADNKWYAVKDAEGKLHAAVIDDQEMGVYYVAALILAGEDHVPVYLKFEGEENGDESELTEIVFSTAEGFRPIKVSDLTDPCTISLCMSVTINEIWQHPTFFLPTSETTFELNADNAKNVSLDYTDIKDIKDITDTDGDGEVYRSRFTIKDIYGNYIDISDIVNNADETVVGIDLARVKPAVYTGEKQKPELVYHGETLVEGKDYTWEFYREPERDMIDIDHYRLQFKGMGRYCGYAVRVFNIILSEDAANQMIIQAEEELRLANQALAAAVASDDHAGLREAYDRLVNAQNALVEAQDALSDTQFILDLAKEEEYEDRLSQLEEQIQELNSELVKARVIDISNYEVTMKKTFVYKDGGVEPEVKVAGLDPSAYRVIYDGSYWVGTARVTIEAKGKDYKGSIVRYYTINPKKAVISSVSPAKRKMTVKAKTKVGKTGGSHYQIRYRMKGTKKWKTLKTAKQTVTIKNLKKGKRYQVQIRAYEKTGGKTYYGAWSKVKTSKKIK